ncbi:ribosome maturation factor RimM [Aurantiacibacter gangjinensis]|uniref:Ribosome maturation factor RimM n=1 Tax=Aurantiacibacter gangjinensis TaxID=502682 RepID=A0A0G9MTR1_9SPHN|nr:ribosome maturation factor RimM [Aurantiacibacter gangjinensis]APE28477.1 16S rRNA processing protein RimM [Aurantiacibacter gangjinensis]KLE32683.1 ribosome maturation factor RimM [Aurantiacibacter gangjinensis]
MVIDKKPIILAAITGAHGVTGEVRLKLFGDGLASLKQHKSFNDGALTPKKLRDDNKGGAIARFAEAQNRSEADKLRGTTLTVSRDALPALEDGEYYHTDLIGLAAVSTDGSALGEVTAVHNFGAGDVIEITLPPVEGKKAKTFMVPMRVEAVPSWNHSTLTVHEDFAER